MLTGEQSGQVHSSAPRLIGDLRIWQFYPRSAGREAVYLVGSISADRFLTVPDSKLPAVRAFLEQIDGKRSLSQAHELMVREHGIDLNVEALYAKFTRAGLAAASSSPISGDIETASATLPSVPLDLLLRAFHVLSPLAQPLIYLGVVLILAASLLTILDPAFQTIAGRMAHAPYSFPGGVVASASLGIAAVVFHELSHCYAATCWGITSGTVKGQLYLGVIPIVALKLAGLYTLPPTGRLTVWGAGVFFNLSATAACLLALRTIAPASATLQTAASLNWLLAVFNLVPLLPTDGYFLLSTLTRDSNVRVRAWSWLRRPLHTRQRPSLFVLAYVVATLWLLTSTLLHLVGSLARAADGAPLWRTALSVAALGLFVLTLRRAFRRKEGCE